MILLKQVDIDNTIEGCWF